MKKYINHFFRTFVILKNLILHEIVRALDLFSINLKDKPKVNLVVAGVARAGTSGIINGLKQHPEIYVGRDEKNLDEDETKFFDQEENFSISSTTQMITNYKNYHNKFFKNIDISKKIICSNAPIYSYWENAIKRLWYYNKEIKLIIILRNPVERAYSHWNKEKNNGREKLSFHEAIQKEMERSKNFLPYQNRNSSYTERGFYTEQIRRAWKFFDKKNVLFIKYDDFCNNPKNIFNSIFEFLNITQIEVKSKYVGKQNYAEKINIEDFEYLREFFFYDICETEKLLKWDCSEWKK